MTFSSRAAVVNRPEIDEDERSSDVADDIQGLIPFFNFLSCSLMYPIHVGERRHRKLMPKPMDQTMKRTRLQSK